MVYLKLLDPEEYLRYLNSDEREKYEYCCEWDGGAYGGMYECDTACLLIYDAVMEALKPRGIKAKLLRLIKKVIRRYG